MLRPRRHSRAGVYYGRMTPRFALLILDASWKDNELFVLFNEAVKEMRNGLVMLSGGVVSDFDHGVTVQPEHYRELEVYIPRAYIDGIVWTADVEEARKKIGFGRGK